MSNTERSEFAPLRAETLGSDDVAGGGFVFPPFGVFCVFPGVVSGALLLTGVKSVSVSAGDLYGISSPIAPSGVFVSARSDRRGTGVCLCQREGGSMSEMSTSASLVAVCFCCVPCGRADEDAEVPSAVLRVT